MFWRLGKEDWEADGGRGGLLNLLSPGFLSPSLGTLGLLACHGFGCKCPIDGVQEGELGLDGEGRGEESEGGRGKHHAAHTATTGGEDH